MSALYGRLTGGRGSATRTGSAASGIVATVQSWDGALTLRLDGDGSWRLERHDARPNGPHGTGQVLAEGVVNDGA